MANNSSTVQSGFLGVLSAGALPESAEPDLESDFKFVEQNHAYIRYTLSKANEYYEYLLRINPALIPYMSKNQRSALRKDIGLAFHHLFSQQKLHEAEGRGKAREDVQQHINTCDKLLDLLETDSSVSLLSRADYQAQQEKEMLQKATLKAIPETLSKQVEEEIALLDRAGSIFLREWMNAINAWRMYWVWTGWMLRQMGAYFSYNSYMARGGEAAAVPQDAALFVSFALYFMRAAVNISLLIRHVFFPLPHEADIPFKERVKAQLDQRGAGILNDVVWGFGNFATSPWPWYMFNFETQFDGINGNSATGFNGLALTAGLLAMDLAVAIGQRITQQKKHEKILAQFEYTQKCLNDQRNAKETVLISAIDALKTVITGDALAALNSLNADPNGVNVTNEIRGEYPLYGFENKSRRRELLDKHEKLADLLKNAQSPDSDAIRAYLGAWEEREILQAQQERFDLRRRHYDMTWNYKRQHLNANITLGAALVGAVVLVGDGFVSKSFDWGVSAAITAQEIMLMGTVCLFVFSLINNIYRGYLEISKVYAEIDTIDADLAALGGADGCFATGETDLDKIQRAQLLADKAYQKQMVQFHVLNTVRKALVEVLLPAALIIGCGALTMGAGFGLMIGIAALSFITRVIFDALMKPKRHMVEAKELPNLGFYPRPIDPPDSPKCFDAAPWQPG